MIGDDTPRCRQDRDTQAATVRLEIFDLGINPASRLGNAPNFLNDWCALVIFELDRELAYASAQFSLSITADVAFALEQRLAHSSAVETAGERTVDICRCWPLRMRVSISAKGSLIAI